jgi:hypothetical protein
MCLQSRDTGSTRLDPCSLARVIITNIIVVVVTRRAN